MKAQCSNGPFLSTKPFQKKFSVEMCIHFPGLKNIDKPVVWVFPQVVVCLDCGTAKFAVPEAELRQPAKGDDAAG
jgi:hypothetical protein